MKIYITGNYTDNDSKVLLDELKSKIKTDFKKVKIITPIDSDLYSKEKSLFLKDRIISMIKSDCVVTLSDWYECKDSVLEVDIARKIGIPVIHHSKIINRLCQR